MIKINSIGYHSCKNELTPFFDFNTPYAWNVESGSGFADHENTKSYYGDRSLRINQTDVQNDLVVSVNEIVTIKHADKYGFSFYFYNDQAFEVIEGELIIKKESGGAFVEYAKESFTVGSQTENTDTEKWIRQAFVSDINLNTGDKIKFCIKIKPNVNTSLSSALMHVDGFMLYKKSRVQTAPPPYEPTSTPSTGNTGSSDRNYILIEGNQFEYIKGKNNTGQTLLEGDVAVNGNISADKFGVLLKYKGNNLDPQLFSSWWILIKQ